MTPDYTEKNTQHSLLRFLIFTAPLALGTRWEQEEEMRAGPKFLTFGNGQHGAALQSMLSHLFLAVLVSNCRTSSSRSRSAIFLSEEFSQPVIYLFQDYSPTGEEEFCCE